MTMRVNGKLINELRIKHSYSQEKLAEVVGVNLRTIQRIEANGTASLGTRGALAKAFGVKPEDLDVREVSSAASPPGGTFGRWPHWRFLTLSAVLIVLGATVLAISIMSVTPIGLVTLPAVIGLLVALIGFTALTRLTPLPRCRTYVVLCIVAVSMLASPPALTIQALIAIALWASFELGILATRLRLPMLHS